MRKIFACAFVIAALALAGMAVTSTRTVAWFDPCVFGRTLFPHCAQNTKVAVFVRKGFDRKPIIWDAEASLPGHSVAVVTRSDPMHPFLH